MIDRQEILDGPYARFYERFGDPTKEMHAAYDSWLADMAARPGNVLEPFEFDPEKYPEQSIYVPMLEAVPARPNLPDNLYYSGFRLTMGRSMGHYALAKLVHQANTHPASHDDPTPFPKRLMANQAAGKNTIVVSSHIKFQEMGQIRAIRHLAKRDRQYIPKNGVLFNLLMTRQKFKGKRLVKHFEPVGKVYFSSPDSDSAQRHGVPESPADLTNALFRKAIKPHLKIGGVELDAALSGSEIKSENDEKGNFSHYLIPEIKPQSAKLVEDFDEAVGITVVGPPVSKNWHMHIGDILDVQELLKTNSAAEVTDMIYSDIIEALERFTKKDVVYSKVSARIGKTAVGHRSGV